jgi:hypothetical protein
MQIVVIFLQPISEGGFIGTIVLLQEFGADLWVIDFAEGVFVEEAFARGTVIGAEPGVRLHRGAVDVPGHDVGGNGAAVFVARITVNDVEHRVAAGVAEERQVREHVVDSPHTSRLKPQTSQPFFVQGDDAFTGSEEADDLGVVAGQRTRPAEGVYAVIKGSREELVEAANLLYAAAGG